MTQVKFRSHFSGKKVRLMGREIRYNIWWRVLGCKPFKTTDTPTALLYVTSHWRRRQYTPLNRRYLFTNLHSITSQKTCACNVATTTSNFAFDLPISCDSRYNSGTLRLLCACAAVAYTPRPTLLLTWKSVQMLTHTTCCCYCLQGRRTLLRNLISCSLLSMHTSFLLLSALR
jgi:hypothetical protein